MTMADVFAITLFHFGILIVLPGSWLLYSAVCPKALERGHDRLRRMPYRSFFLGLLIGGAGTGLVALLAAAGLHAPAGILGALAAGFALFGAASFAKAVGSRLTAPGDTPWKSHARGGVVLLLPCMIPFLGWFLLFPIVLAIGVGAGTMALFPARPAAAAATIPAPAALPDKVEVLA